jgi:hypothetical protein
MSNTIRLLGFTVTLLALACGDDSGGGAGMGAGTTAATPATGGMMATTGGMTATGGTMTATGGTGAGTMATMCGAVMCAAGECCTAMMECGMMSPLGMCLPAFVDPGGHMCPDETIAGMMVPGCCTEGGVECGVVDSLTGSGCASRATASQIAVALGGMPLEPINCDGTMPMASPDAGM